MAEFEKVGVEATVKGFAIFMAQMNAVNGAIAASGASGAAAAGGLGLMNVALLGIGAAAVGVVVAVTAIAAGFATLAVVGANIARSVESAFAGVAKTTNGLVDEFGVMTEAGVEVLDQFRDLAKEVPLALEELLEIGQLAGQLGVAKESLAGFSEVIAALATSTNLSADQATLALARIANIYEVETEDMVDNTERLGSSIVFLGNNFATTESEISDFAKRIAGVAKVAGISQAEIAGIGAAFTSVGVEAQAGGTAVQTVLIEMTKAVALGGDELEVFAATSGRTVDEFTRLFERDAAKAFEEFVVGLGNAGNDAFTILEDLGIADRRLIRGFLAVAGAGDLLTDTIDGSSKAWEANTALAREANIRYNTFDSQLQIFKNSLRDVGLEIGQILLPHMKGLLDAAGPIVDAIGEGLTPAFETVFDALREKLLPALGELFDALGFDVTTASLTKSIKNFGDTIADGIENFSLFVLDVAELTRILREGGVLGLLEHFGIDEVTAQTITDIATALGVAAIALGGLNVAIGIFNLGASIMAGIIAALSSPVIVLALLIGVLAVFGERAAVALGQLTIIVGLKIAEMFQKAKEGWEDIKILAGVLWGAIGEELSRKWDEIKVNIGLFFIDMVASWQENLELLKTLGALWWERIKENWQTSWNIIKVEFLLFLLRILQAIQDKKDDMLAAGHRLMQGFFDGVKSLAQEIVDWVAGFGQSIVDTINNVFGNQSPSKVFKKVGENLMKGLALGIRDNMDMPQVALDTASANIVNAGQGVVSGGTMGRESNIDRSFNAGGMTFITRPEAPNRVADDLALLTQLSG